MSPSADWELQVLVVELVELVGVLVVGSTYPDDSPLKDRMYQEHTCVD